MQNHVVMKFDKETRKLTHFGIENPLEGLRRRTMEEIWKSIAKENERLGD